MSTVAIDATHPSATINLAVLKKCLERILEADRRNQPVTLSPDEYILLNEIRYAVTTGVGSTNVVSAVTMTY